MKIFLLLSKTADGRMINIVDGFHYQHTLIQYTMWRYVFLYATSFLGFPD